MAVPFISQAGQVVLVKQIVPNPKATEEDFLLALDATALGRGTHLPVGNVVSGQRERECVGL